MEAIAAQYQLAWGMLSVSVKYSSWACSMGVLPWECSFGAGKRPVRVQSVHRPRQSIGGGEVISWSGSASGSTGQPCWRRETAAAARYR